MSPFEVIVVLVTVFEVDDVDVFVAEEEVEVMDIVVDEMLDVVEVVNVMVVEVVVILEKNLD